MFKGFYNLTSGMLTQQRNLNVVGDDTLNLEIGSGGNKVTLSVDVKAGMTSADIATAIAEKLDAEKGGIQSFTDDQNVRMDFKVKADGNSLQFTGTETKAFNPPTTVSYSLTNTGMNPEDDITVKDTGITLSATPYKSTGSGKDATTALASAPLETPLPRRPVLWISNLLPLLLAPQTLRRSGTLPTRTA